MNERLKHELISLFGRDRVERAEVLDVVDLPITAAAMQTVQVAADALLKETGKAHRQRELVDDLDNTTALLLCMWLMDTDFMGRCLDNAA